MHLLLHRDGPHRSQNASRTTWVARIVIRFIAVMVINRFRMSQRQCQSDCEAQHNLFRCDFLLTFIIIETVTISTFVLHVFSHLAIYSDIQERNAQCLSSLFPPQFMFHLIKMMTIFPVLPDPKARKTTHTHTSCIADSTAFFEQLQWHNHVIFYSSTF